MPRSRKLRFKGDLPLVAGRGYPMYVAAVMPEGDGWHVLLRHLSEDRLGQAHTLFLPSEAPCDGAIAGLFRACGLNVQLSTEIDPREAEGRTVNAIFYTSTSGGSGIIGFEPIRKENKHEPDA